MTVAETFLSNISSPPAKTKFETSCRWMGGKSGVLQTGDKEPLAFSRGPEFNGEASKWSSEELLVAAVEACTMAAFLSLAERDGLPIAWYSSTAEGFLEKREEQYRLTRVIVRPTVALRPGQAAERAFRLLRKAHHQCLPGASLFGELWFEPTVEIFDD